MIALVVKSLIAYAVGSVVGSLLIGGFRGVDIRTLGSGNAGATNALRTQGKGVALAVLVIDLGKGWIATGLLGPWALPRIAAAQPSWHAWDIAACGIAVMLGHVWPVWYGLRGGKGMATLLGATLGIHAWLLLPMILAWLATVICCGFVGLGSILAAIALPVTVAVSRPVPRAPLMGFAIVALLLIVFTHRANIARMRAGTEPRARRLWLLGARRQAL